MTRAERIHRRREAFAWAQIVGYVVVSVALTWLGWSICREADARLDEQERRMELRREIRQLIREADEVREDSPMKGLANYGKLIGVVLLAATEEA